MILVKKMGGKGFVPGQSAKEVKIRECGGGKGGYYLSSWSLLIDLGLDQKQGFLALHRIFFLKFKFTVL